MEYTVRGTRFQHITTKVDAESLEEAIQKAGSGYANGIEVWDTKFEWFDGWREDADS